MVQQGAGCRNISEQPADEGLRGDLRGITKQKLKGLVQMEQALQDCQHNSSGEMLHFVRKDAATHLGDPWAGCVHNVDAAIAEQHHLLQTGSKGGQNDNIIRLDMAEVLDALLLLDDRDIHLFQSLVHCWVVDDLCMHNGPCLGPQQANTILHVA